MGHLQIFKKAKYIHTYLGAAAFSFPFFSFLSLLSFFRSRSRSRSLSEPQLRCYLLCVATMRFPVVSGSSIVLSLYLSQTTSAQEPEAFRNGTLSWGSSPLIYSKRTTTCSGTCAECYGSGSIYCGTNDACFNPTIGESCCAEYSYSCSDGYYCAPDGLDMQCCSNVSPFGSPLCARLDSWAMGIVLPGTH
jgi:hypothetical protein